MSASTIGIILLIFFVCIAVVAVIVFKKRDEIKEIVDEGKAKLDEKKKEVTEDLADRVRKAGL